MRNACGEGFLTGPAFGSPPGVNSTRRALRFVSETQMRMSLTFNESIIPTYLVGQDP